MYEALHERKVTTHKSQLPLFPHLLHDLAERRKSQEIPCLAVGAHSLRNAQARGLSQ
jgi:hypothetical protein